jgi:hypothetical protein
MEQTGSVTDATIADFRAANSEALDSSVHPLHGQRLAELSSLYEMRFASPAEIAAPDGTATEYRLKHDAVLNDKTHPDHAVRVAELTKLHERDDLVGGNQPADDLAPSSSPDDFDFAHFKGTVQAPLGVELEQNPELERQARTWMHDAGLSRVEGEALASIYGQSFSWSADEITRIQQSTATGLRKQYGDDAGRAAAAALQVAEESGAFEFLETTGLINHWQVVGTLISTAERKGYFKRTSE